MLFVRVINSCDFQNELKYLYLFRLMKNRYKFRLFECFTEKCDCFFNKTTRSDGCATLTIQTLNDD